MPKYRQIEREDDLSALILQFKAFNIENKTLVFSGFFH